MCAITQAIVFYIMKSIFKNKTDNHSLVLLVQDRIHKYLKTNL